MRRRPLVVCHAEIQDVSALVVVVVLEVGACDRDAHEGLSARIVVLGRTVPIHPGSLLKSTTTCSQAYRVRDWRVEALAAWSWIVFPMVGPRDRLEDRLDVVEQPVAAALGEVQVRAGVEYDPPTVGVNSVLFVTLHGCHDTGACGRRMRGAYAPTRATILGLERVVLVPTTTKCTSKMQRSGGYWNQDAGAIDKIVSELLAALAAQEAQAGLSRVAEKLAGLRASDAQPRAITSRRLRPRRPGWVLDAVREVMAEPTGPMRVAQVHAAVEALLGEAVSKDSVSWVPVRRCPQEGATVRANRARAVRAGA